MALLVAIPVLVLFPGAPAPPAAVAAVRRSAAESLPIKESDRADVSDLAQHRRRVETQHERRVRAFRRALGQLEHLEVRKALVLAQEARRVRELAQRRGLAARALQPSSSPCRASYARRSTTPTACASTSHASSSPGS